ncbi:MAG: alpha/beta hydrolase [Candidatus Wildermuthbacteria bacterium]|nr:alpha/beta hydrolase [Candidatus Wildermuthbacteria bacterium]
MKTIETKNFELAVYAKGDVDSPRIAIVIPGRLDTKDYVHNTSSVDYLASRGYFALSFDPPGTWESPGDIELYTTSNCIKAVDEIIEYFGNKPTLLAGHSRGGTIAMLAGPKNPYVTHFVSIFSYYGAPSEPEEERIVDGKVISYRDLPPGNIKTKEQKEFGLPLNYFEDGKQYNALVDLRKCVKPKLFFYGVEDEMNDPEDVKKAYEESAEPKTIYALNSDHDYRYHPKIIEEANEAIGRFLDRYRIE